MIRDRRPGPRIRGAELTSLLMQFIRDESTGRHVERVVSPSRAQEDGERHLHDIACGIDAPLSACRHGVGTLVDCCHGGHARHRAES